MKLWQKIFLGTLALTVLACSLLSVLLLRSSYEVMLGRERQRALDETAALAAQLSAAVAGRRLESGTFRLSNAQVRAESAALLAQADTGAYLRAAWLYRGDVHVASTDPGSALRTRDLARQTPAGQSLLCTRRQGENWYILAVVPFTMEWEDYRMVCSFDVSELFLQRALQIETARRITLAASLLAAAVLLVVVWALLRPLGTLSRSARRIAGGRYAERAAVRGRDELALLAQDMNEMAGAVEGHVRQLEQVAADREVFIANLAHEMKTPLTSILGFADLLSIQKKVDDEKRAEYAGIIVEETRRLKALSGKLLELITVGTTNLEFARRELRPILAETAAAVQPMLRNAGMKLEWACADAAVEMDAELFKSLLYNLIDNARKASPAGGRILLSAWPQGGDVFVTVQDFGQGIPPEALEKICQPFYMVDKSRSRRAGGAGLGLALCKKIVDIHKGSIRFSSRVGEGTLVSLRFPAARGEGEGE